MEDRIIYVIYERNEGWGLDFNYLHFVRTEEEALKACMELNEKCKSPYRYYSYFELDEFCVSDEKKVYYEYKILAHFDEDCKTWELYIDDVNAVKNKKTFDIEEIEKENESHVEVTLCLDFLNRTEALKIAEDMLYNR